MKRFGQIIGTRTEQFERYKSYHSNVWPEVLENKRLLLKNYSIFYKNGFLFAYFKYNGEDFAKDMQKMAADPKTQEWWEIMKPMQQPVINRLNDEWRANMEEIFHLD